MIEVSLRLPLDGDLPGVVQRLQDAGIARRQIELLSREPLPESLLPVKPSRMSRVGVIGALLGFAVAVAVLVTITLDYRLRTGGMPLVAPLPLGIIVYEMTLLASILAMVLTLFVGARLGPGRRVAEHPELERGEAIVSITCGDVAQAERARQVLSTPTPARP
jgi:hypothetical protein